MLPYDDGTTQTIGLVIFSKGFENFAYYKIDMSDGSGISDYLDSTTGPGQGGVRATIYDIILSSSGELVVVGLNENFDNKLIIGKIRDGVHDKTFAASEKPYIVITVTGSVIDIHTGMDSGDGLILFTVEQADSKNIYGSQRVLAADRVHQLVSTSLLDHPDLAQLANYSNDVDFLTNYMLPIFIDLSSNSVVASSLYTFNNVVLKSIFEKAIARATANGFPSCLSMKYKRGLALREFYKEFSDSDAAASILLETLESIALEFDTIRAELISA